MSKLPPYFKAIAAAVFAGLGSLEVASADNHFTAKELITAGIITLGALLGVYAVPNDQTQAAASDAHRAVLGAPNPDGTYGE